jgi:O-antigen ligase
MMAPFGFLAFAALYVTSPRLRAMTLGGGEHQASTDSRIEMWWMGLPRILERPLFGHGSGLGAEVLGFTNLAGILTIDSYWLSALLEFGLVGALALLGMIVWCIHAGFKAYLSPDRGVNLLGAPIAIALIAFLVIKLVLSQSDNHLLVFTMIAMMTVIRMEAQSAGLAASPAQPTPGVKPGLLRRNPRAGRPPHPTHQSGPAAQPSAVRSRQRAHPRLQAPRRAESKGLR